MYCSRDVDKWPNVVFGLGVSSAPLSWSGTLSSILAPFWHRLKKGALLHVRTVTFLSSYVLLLK